MSSEISTQVTMTLPICWRVRHRGPGVWVVNRGAHEAWLPVVHSSARTRGRPQCSLWVGLSCVVWIFFFFYFIVSMYYFSEKKILQNKLHMFTYHISHQIVVSCKDQWSPTHRVKDFIYRFLYGPSCSAHLVRYFPGVKNIYHIILFSFPV